MCVCVGVAWCVCWFRVLFVSVCLFALRMFVYGMCCVFFVVCMCGVADCCCLCVFVLLLVCVWFICVVL